MSDPLARGVELFNAGDYRPALDAFEEPYHRTARAHGELYLGLLRAAAAMYHFSGGRVSAARKLWLSAREVLARPSVDPEGLDLAALLADLETTFAPLLAAEGAAAAALRPAMRPAIRRLATA